MQRPPPEYSLELVLHPEQDPAFVHFENASANPFEPGAPAVSRVNAWWLAEAALLTYWNPTAAPPIYRAAGFQSEFLSHDSTDCYVLAQKDFVVVAFRGTQPGDWSDILADVNIALVPSRAGMVHLGFKRALDAILPELDASLARLGPDRTLWFCGHSLGGALATLAADHYAATRGVCTFGSPRVGDAAFVRAFDARFGGASLRYVNNHDVVTHVPPPIGYAHVDQRRLIAPDGSITTGTPAVPHFFADLIGKPETLLDMIKALSAATPRGAPLFLLDHMPKAYAVWVWNDYDANR